MMNERIKELAEQAGLKWKAQPPHYTNTNNPIDFPVSANRDLEKFAELIVRECINIGDNYEDILGNEPECFNCRKVAYGIVDKIKQHFGVEE
jgi:hypothetical protein